MYGEIDWMDPTAAIELVTTKKVNAKLYLVNEANHHLYMDNPVDTLYKLIMDVFGEE